MTKKVRVQLFGHQRRGIDVDADATDGSVIGENLYLPDGTLVTQQMVINNSTTIITTGGPIAVSPTLWGLILDIPAFILSLAALATNGLVAYVSGVATARTIVGETGRIDVTDGDGQAGNPVIELGDWPTVRNAISVGEAYTVPSGHQLICSDSFDADGTLTVDGELVVDSSGASSNWPMVKETVDVGVTVAILPEYQLLVADFFDVNGLVDLEGTLVIL